MLERIVYISAAVGEQTDAIVNDILTVSQARNGANGITGLLLGGGCWWMQLIEGESERLDPIWQSIRQDGRHSPVVLVQRRIESRRAFPDWHMQFRRTRDEQFEVALGKLTGGIGDPRLKDQIKRFSRSFLRPPGRQWREDAA